MASASAPKIAAISAGSGTTSKSATRKSFSMRKLPHFCSPSTVSDEEIFEKSIVPGFVTLNLLLSKFSITMEAKFVSVSPEMSETSKSTPSAKNRVSVEVCVGSVMVENPSRLKVIVGVDFYAHFSAAYV